MRGQDAALLCVAWSRKDRLTRVDTLGVQYMGVRFDPEELLRDLQALMQEEARS